MDWLTEALEEKRKERERVALRAACHEASHAVVARLVGGHPIYVFTATPADGSRTRIDLTGVKWLDVLTIYAAGAEGLLAFGWRDAARFATGDAKKERLMAIQAAHLLGRALDQEFIDSIIEVGHLEARTLVRDNHQAIASLGHQLYRSGRLVGDELDRALDTALMTVPAYAEQEAAFTRAWDGMMVRNGFARPLRA